MASNLRHGMKGFGQHMLAKATVAWRSRRNVGSDAPVWRAAPEGVGRPFSSAGGTMDGARTVASANNIDCGW